MIKLKFKNGVGGSFVDWTDSTTIHSVGSVRRRLESRSKGEAGIIVYDKLPLNLRFESGSNPVYNAFGGDLTAAQRYIFELYGIKDNATDSKLFEGMADFSTIDWPEDEKKINFDVVDKLSSLDLVNLSLPRTLSQLDTDPLDDTRFRITYEGSGRIIMRKWINWSTTPSVVTFTSNIVPGSILCTQDPNGEAADKQYYLVKAVQWDTREFEGQTHDVFVIDVTTAITIGNNDWDFKFFYYQKNYFNIDINIVENIAGLNTLTGFDGLKLIEAIVKKVWTSLTILNYSGETTYSLALSYYTQLIDEYPFGSHPLDALKLLAASIQSYIFFNKLGQLVLKRKSTAPLSPLVTGTERTYTPSRRRKGGRKKQFWDKLADAVTVNVRSGVIVEGAELIGTSTWQKYSGLKPRNEIKIEIFAPSTIELTQDALNLYAATIANDVYQFYGLRHYYRVLNSDLLDEMLDWDLLDLITIDGEKYFIISSELNIGKLPRSASFELVSVTAYDYDYQQARSVLSPATYNATSGGNYTTGSSSSGGGTVALNAVLTGLSALDSTAGILVQTTSNAFAKRILTSVITDKPAHFLFDNPAGTAGNINIKVNPLAEFKVGKLGIGVDEDASYFLKVGDGANLNTAWFRGNIKVDGDIYIDGVVNQVDVTEMHVADKVVRVNVDGDNTTAIGSGIVVEGTGASDLASILYDGNWTHNKSVNVSSGLTYKINNVDRLSETVVNLATGGAFKINSVDRLTDSLVNLASGGVYKINSVDVLNATTLGANVVNSSLTKVGTVVTGVWNATKITAPYIDYNTTNLKNSSNLLNTIQDIATTSSPQFVNVTLTGVIDQQGTADSEFGSQYIVPKQKYYSNLGTLQKKWLTLHAAELWVETLVAQETIATIGGRVLVGPTSSLINDLSAGATTIDVKHNSFVNQDVVYMEANGKIEFMRITSSYTGITGGYRYSVTRNLDGTGANDWYAGDAVFNTGQTGNGFIDLYSVRGIKSSSQYGPTIVGNIRNSSTYNDWSEAWAIGELRGLYGYSSNAYGAGFGKYAANVNNLVIDSTNGIRFRNYDTVLARWNASTIELGEIGAGKNHIAMNADTINFKNNTTVIASWVGSTITLGEVGASKANVLLTSSAIALRTNTTERIKLNSDGSGFLASNNINWNTSGVINMSGFQVDAHKIWKAPIYIGGNAAEYLDSFSIENTLVMGIYNSTSTRLVIRGSSVNNFVQMSLISGNPIIQAGANVSGTNVYVNMGYLPSSDYGFSLRETTTDHFKFTKDEKHIGGINFNSTGLFAVASSNYAGLQKAVSTSTKVFFAGASDAAGTDAKFYVDPTGKLITTDASGNVLFDSSAAFLDAKNIGDTKYQNLDGFSTTSSSYVLVAEGCFYLKENETRVTLLCSTYTNADDTEGRVRLKIYKEATSYSAPIGYTYKAEGLSVIFGNGHETCFDVSSTYVEGLNGQVLLKEIKRGDFICSDKEIVKVEKVIEAEVDEYYQIACEGSTLSKVTGSHPFLTMRGFMPIQNISIGEKVLTKKGWKKLEIKEYVEAKLKVKALTVSGSHTYWANNYLVHNKGGDTQAYSPNRCSIDVSNTGTFGAGLYKFTIELVRNPGTGTAFMRNMILQTSRNVFEPVAVAKPLES